MRTVARHLVACFFFAWLPASLWAQSGRYLADTGPLRIRDQFLLGIGFLAFDPVSADIVEKGKWQVDLILTVSNDFAHSDVIDEFLAERTQRGPLTLAQLRGIEAEDPGGGVFLIDGEHYRTAIAVRRGVGRNLQVELVIPIISFQGGVLDSSIESFHDAFSLAQAGRLGVPKNAFEVYVRSAEGELFVDEDPGVALGDIVVGTKFGLWRESKPRSIEAAGEVLVKLPTGDEESFTGSGSTDLGFQLLVTKYFRKSCLHASVGLAYLGEMKTLGLDSQVNPSGMLAYERGLGTKNSILVQATVSQSPFRQLDLEELTRVSTQLTLGYKRVLGKQVLFLGVTENVASFNNSPDIGFHVGLTRVF